jgi:RimJ/RimL family protein N-acetyltransferase
MVIRRLEASAAHPGALPVDDKLRSEGKPRGGFVETERHPMNTLAFSTGRPERSALPGAYPGDMLELERLVLRRPAEEDIVAMTALADNIRIASKLPDMPHPYTIADAGRFIRRLHDHRNGLSGFAILERESGTLVGCGKIEAGENDSEGRIGFWTGEPYWNRGYMTEAAQALIDHAFTHSPHRITIRASVTAINPAARRVLEKCGFQYAGPGAETDIRMGCLVPVDHYQIDRGIWKAIKVWSRASATRHRQIA